MEQIKNITNVLYITDQGKKKVLASDGIAFSEKTYRFYPESNIGSNLLGFVGFVGDDQKGRYGLEGDLTDIEASQIVDVVVPPYFRTGDYAGGVRAAVVGIMQSIGGETNILPAKNGSGKSFPWGDYFWIFIGLFMWLVSVLARSRSWWLGGVIGAVAGGIIWFVWSVIAALPGLIIGGVVSSDVAFVWLEVKLKRLNLG